MFQLNWKTSNATWFCQFAIYSKFKTECMESTFNFMEVLVVIDNFIFCRKFLKKAKMIFNICLTLQEEGGF